MWIQTCTDKQTAGQIHKHHDNQKGNRKQVDRRTQGGPKTKHKKESEEKGIFSPSLQTQCLSELFLSPYNSEMKKITRHIYCTNLPNNQETKTDTVTNRTQINLATSKQDTNLSLRWFCRQAPHDNLTDNVNRTSKSDRCLAFSLSPLFLNQ